MSTLLGKVPLPVQGLALHAAFALPQPLRRVLAGPPIRRDGLELALDAQLLLRLFAMTDTNLTRGTPDQARAHLEATRGLIARPAATGVRTSDLDIASGDDTIPARLYEPVNLPAGSPLLVYFHGGGWVIGSVDTHDAACRYLARNPQVRVLSVGYRLAPEHPSPPRRGTPSPRSGSRRGAPRRCGPTRRRSRSAGTARGRTSPRRSACRRSDRGRGRCSSCCSTRQRTRPRGAVRGTCSPTGSSSPTTT